MFKRSILLFCCSLLSLLFFSCSEERSETKTRKLEVKASAYNSLHGQTEGDPSITAWGDTLRPGMKCIAVSRDLIDSGLTHGTEVEIEDLPGKYKVLDKMNRRWTKKIDIYMGGISKDAKEWGVKTVTIGWRPEVKAEEEE